MALPASELQRLVSRGGILSRGGFLGRGQHPSEGLPAGEREEAARVLPLGGALDAIDAALPDGGLPRGAVVEVASVHGLARATSLAVAACAAAQSASRAWSTRAAWCAWLDPWGTLHAPAVRAAKVELERLLVVRPTPSSLARTAARVVASGVFSVVVVDTVQPLGFAEPIAPATAGGASPGDATSSETSSGGAGSDGSSGVDAWMVRLDRWPTVVRRLALAVEGSDTTVLLLTDLSAARGLPLPVAMRIELEHRVERDGASAATAMRRSYLRVAKERQGRVGGFIPIETSQVVGALRPALRSATSGG